MFKVTVNKKDGTITITAPLQEGQKTAKGDKWLVSSTRGTVTVMDGTQAYGLNLNITQPLAAK